MHNKYFPMANGYECSWRLKEAKTTKKYNFERSLDGRNRCYTYSFYTLASLQTVFTIFWRYKCLNVRVMFLNHNPHCIQSCFPLFISSNWHEQFHTKFSLNLTTTKYQKTCMIVQCLLYIIINISIEYRHLFVPRKIIDLKYLSMFWKLLRIWFHEKVICNNHNLGHNNFFEFVIFCFFKTKINKLELLSTYRIIYQYHRNVHGM